MRLGLRDFFSQILGPGGTGQQPGMRLCIDFSQHLLAKCVRINDILQINGKSFPAKLRSGFNPDPPQLRNPGARDASFQRHAHLAFVVLNRDLQRMPAPSSSHALPKCMRRAKVRARSHRIGAALETQALGQD